MESRLIRGIERFKSHVFGPKKAMFEQLAQGQKPHTLFITCSDSRIQPDVITGTDPGELFVLRNVGNIVPPHGWGQTEAEAVVEYATVALGVHDIVVCGHAHCGAMKALLEPEHLGQLPTVAAWLAHAEETRARVQQKYGHLKGKELLDATIKENVLVQVERVKALPSVAPRLASGLDVHGWVYQFESGEILHYSKERDAFLPITAEEVARELAS
jgi:carbonic anhydrase